MKSPSAQKTESTECSYSLAIKLNRRLDNSFVNIAIGMQILAIFSIHIPTGNILFASYIRMAHAARS